MTNGRKTKEEKNEFINGLKSELKDNRVDFKQIQLSSEIAPERIIAAMDTLRENIFIPTSGRNANIQQHYDLYRLHTEIPDYRPYHPCCKALFYCYRIRKN